MTTLKASPTLVTTASFKSGSGSVVGSAIPEDSAVLSSGYQESGPLTFTLTAPSSTVVDTETVTPSGNGTYNTSNVTIATQAGVYTWTVSFAADGLNNGAHDQGGTTEQVTTLKASPTLVTTASFKTGSGNVVGVAIPEDSAVLSGGYQESGPLTFTLTAPNNSVVDTQTITPNGDGTYSTTNTNIATQAGFYTWTVSFVGDGLNNGAHDQGGAAEQVKTFKAGTWTALAHAAPGGLGTMELLTDGTVMAVSGGNYYKLTPDATGSYVNGSWSQLASPSVQRLYDATNVLQDGRVFVLGGEYSGPSNAATWTNTGEIYNPATNVWANMPSFPLSQFGDDPSTLLPDGRVLVGYLSGPQTYIYNPATNIWSTGPTKLYNDQSDEETWTKLADGSILSYDIFGNTQEAQRLDPTTMTWIDSGTVPVKLDSGGEIGPALLLPDGRLFQIGA